MQASSRLGFGVLQWLYLVDLPKGWQFPLLPLMIILLQVSQERSVNINLKQVVTEPKYLGKLLRDSQMLLFVTFIDWRPWRTRLCWSQEWQMLWWDSRTTRESAATQKQLKMQKRCSFMRSSRAMLERPTRETLSFNVIMQIYITSMAATFWFEYANCLHWEKQTTFMTSKLFRSHGNFRCSYDVSTSNGANRRLWRTDPIHRRRGEIFRSLRLRYSRQHRG